MRSPRKHNTHERPPVNRVGRTPPPGRHPETPPRPTAQRPEPGRSGLCCPEPQQHPEGSWPPPRRTPRRCRYGSTSARWPRSGLPGFRRFLDQIEEEPTRQRLTPDRLPSLDQAINGLPAVDNLCLPRSVKMRSLEIRPLARMNGPASPAYDPAAAGTTWMSIVDNAANLSKFSHWAAMILVSPIRRRRG